jgi:thiol-disulfide isomerase/thioredoxin
MVIEISMNHMMEASPIEDEWMRIVMFFGSTCGPCKKTMPHYETIASYFSMKSSPILFYKINAWEPIEQKEYCEQVWGINGVPHFKAFLLGNVIHTKQGGGDEQTMFKFAQECIDEAFKQHGVRI